MNALQEYQAALEGLYLEFAKYPFRPDMPACIPHCFKQSEIDALGSKPLRELGSSELGRLSCKLITTCGEVEDFKFLMPRIFELASQDQLNGACPEVVFERLQMTEWKIWDNSEQNVVKQFLDSWWNLELSLIGNVEDAFVLENCFGALCCTGLNPRVWMELWREQSPMALANFIGSHFFEIRSGKGFNGFVKDERINSSVRDFIREPETRLALERAFLASNDLEEQEILSSAEQLLRP
jgi:hypothetical protein